jgi:hypothetical protein
MVEDGEDEVLVDIAGDDAEEAVHVCPSIVGKQFFFVNKKEPKKTLLICWFPAGVSRARRGADVFLVLFFQKKNFFLPTTSPP